MTATTGTWLAVIVNAALAVVGVLQAADLTTLLGSSSVAGYFVLALGILNTVLHAVTGNAPIVGPKA